MHIRAGDLDRQLTVRGYVPGVDRLGATYESYQDIATVWASKKVLRADSKNLNNQNVPIADVEFHIYYDPNLQIDQNSQLFCDGVTYQMIQPPIEEGMRREWLKLVCREHIFNKKGGL